MTAEPSLLEQESIPSGATDVVDGVAVARLYGEPLFSVPRDLYIPPDALEIFLEAFEGPLDVLLYLIRKQNFNILDIPMAALTRQYLDYIEEIRSRNLELAAEYLLMAAMLIEIKSRMLLPARKSADGQEPEDPRAELARRLREYEQIKLVAQSLQQLPQAGRCSIRWPPTTCRPTSTSACRPSSSARKRSSTSRCSTSRAPRRATCATP